MADRDRLAKLLGMLGSDFDGERATAAGMIAKMAKDEKVGIADMCLGKAGIGQQAAMGALSARYEQLRQEHDQLLQNANYLRELCEDQGRKLSVYVKREKNKATPPSGGMDFNNVGTAVPDPIHTARRIWERYEDVLVGFERDFIESMCDREEDYQLSPKQMAVMERIYKKYRV